jgi:SAM-dependent methyltransferase
MSSKAISELDPTLVEHRRIWETKPALRIIYADYHRRLLNACPPGLVLDIGGGSAHVKHYRQDVISVDILPFPGIDVVCDAHVLPFVEGRFSGIVILDVLHHLGRPVDFLREAARVLRRVPELRLVTVDWLSVVAYPLSGGFKPWCLGPADAAVGLNRFEYRLPRGVRHHAPFRLFVVLERIAK